jgi:hypothetical protein
MNYFLLNDRKIKILIAAEHCSNDDPEDMEFNNVLFMIRYNDENKKSFFSGSETFFVYNADYPRIFTYLEPSFKECLKLVKKYALLTNKYEVIKVFFEKNAEGNQ